MLLSYSRLFCCCCCWCVVFFKFIRRRMRFHQISQLADLLLVCTSFVAEKEVWRESHESICSSMDFTLLHDSSELQVKLNWMINMLTMRGTRHPVATVVAQLRTRERQLAALAEKETRKQITDRIVRTRIAESMTNWKYLGASLLI